MDLHKADGMGILTATAIFLMRGRGHGMMKQTFPIQFVELVMIAQSTTLTMLNRLQTSVPTVTLLPKNELVECKWGTC